MSDFDDEPGEGTEATDEAAAAPQDAEEATVKRPRSKPVPDDDWDDDWDDEDTGREGKRDLTVVYAIVAAAIVIVVAVVLTRPKDDNSSSTAEKGNDTATTQPTEFVKNWQGAVGDAVGKDGADAQKRAESAPGVYIWTDFGGWHLRSNNEKDVVVTVTADQVRVKKTDDGDDSDESADTPFSTETTVTLPAGDGKDGVGLDLGTSESATFTVTIDGENIPASEIFLGGAEGVADQNPVTFVKS